MEKMVAGWLEDGMSTYEKAESHIQRLTKQEDDGPRSGGRSAAGAGD